MNFGEKRRKSHKHSSLRIVRDTINILSVLCKYCAHGNIWFAQCVFKLTFEKNAANCTSTAPFEWCVWECSEWLFSSFRKVYLGRDRHPVDSHLMNTHTSWTLHTLSRPPTRGVQLRNSLQNQVSFRGWLKYEEKASTQDFFPCNGLS